MKEAVLFCGKLTGGPNGDKFFDFYPHPDLVSMCGHDEIFKVRVTEIEIVPDVSAILGNGPAVKDHEGYYAWWAEEEQTFMFTAPSPHLVEICFPYGSRAGVKRGKGQVYRVNVEVISE